MEQDIRDLIDKQFIIELSYRYAQAVDNRQRNRMRDFFMPDGVLSMLSLGDFVGVDAIENALSIIARLDVTQHVITNHIIALNGDRATMECYIIATHIKHDDPRGSIFTAGGQYVDELVRFQSGWKIARRTAKMLWTDGNAAMLFPDGV